MTIHRSQGLGRIILTVFHAMLLQGWETSRLHATPADRDRPFEIQVVDDETGRGVPLVELRTVNDIVMVTDSAGRVAFDEPGLMGQTVYFHVQSHGYEFPADGFGYRGKALKVEPGGRAELKISRRNIAERLYRITGQGIYRDSTSLGHQAPIKEPNLNGQVLGQDSVLSIEYKGRVYWFWGDTNRASYPLGNFHTPGAYSENWAIEGLSPHAGVNLRYFTDASGFARPTCQIPGDGPTWCSGLVVIGFGDHQRMLASYAKIKPPLETYERGFVEWDDTSNTFVKRTNFDKDYPLKPDGHPLFTGEETPEGVRQWIQFCQPFPLVRVRWDVDSYLDIEKYEAFTCLKPGSRHGSLEVERDAAGKPLYAWKPSTAPTGPAEQDELKKAGLLNDTEQLICLRDIETGKSVRGHGGSVSLMSNPGSPNPPRYALIAVELGGSSSFLGEVWYAEANHPLGPWVYARKVLTHDRYSFYNPKIHDEFSDLKHLYFEGTYTASFSGNPIKTPRYEYNQIMYWLTLDDPRLALPVAFRIDRRTGLLGTIDDEFQPGSVLFHAPIRPIPHGVPVYGPNPEDGQLSLVAPVGKKEHQVRPLFFALPADMTEPPPSTEPLFEHINRSGEITYALESQPPAEGFRRVAKPLCRVWVGAGIWAKTTGLAVKP